MIHGLRNFYDVIVVGAGPAGSVAARYAAENGASVLMLERDREPGIPVRCAEGVSHAGIEHFIDIDEKWISTTIDGAILHAPNGEYVEMRNNGRGYVLERRVFDRALADLAVEKGTTLFCKTDVTDLLKDDSGQVCGVRFTHLNKSYEVKAHLVIGADGIESQVGRWAGINTTLQLGDLDTCVQYTVNNIKVDPEMCQFYFGENVSPGGYLWIFPKSDKSANIGIGVSGDMTKPGRGPKYFLDQFMQKNYPEASVNYVVYGGVPTLAGKNFITDHVMLVGDAARQVNPITGGGIVQGMIAGRLCGETAAKAIKNNNYSKKYLNEYEKRWDDMLGANQRFMYSIKTHFMNMNDDKFNSIVKAAKGIPTDSFNMYSLFKEAVKEDPLLVAKMATSFIVSKLKF